MKNSLRLYFVASVFTLTLALFPSALHAQYVYVNDNNFAPANSNTVYGFEYSSGSLVPILGEPTLGWPTSGTSVLHADALKDQAVYSNSAVTCLYVAEPLPSSAHANGDIAAFSVSPTSGVLTYVGSYGTPATFHTYWGIALTTRFTPATLYAGYSYTGGNHIASWGINPKTCTLTLQHQLAVTPLNGGYIGGMAEAHNGQTLVVAYVDGSIQSFSTPPTGPISPNCLAALDSTGFITQGSMPSGVDITKDSMYAIFGDVSGPYPHGPTELEVVKLPIACSGVTVDFGGTAVASATSLGSYIDSENVWLSPNQHFIYVTNNGPISPQGFTTVKYTEPYALSLASGCTTGYTNPTTMASLNTGFFEPSGIQTRATTGNGTQVYVADYEASAPSSGVALLNVDVAGCTQEQPGSPFADPNGAGGASQISAVPPRPF
jgi:hypothetical protein